MLGDEKLVSERLAQERDNAEKNARQNETKVLSSLILVYGVTTEQWRRLRHFFGGEVL